MSNIGSTFGLLATCAAGAATVPIVSGIRGYATDKLFKITNNNPKAASLFAASSSTISAAITVASALISPKIGILLSGLQNVRADDSIQFGLSLGTHLVESKSRATGAANIIFLLASIPLSIAIGKYITNKIMGPNSISNWQIAKLKLSDLALDAAFTLCGTGILASMWMYKKP